MSQDHERRKNVRVEFHVSARVIEERQGGRTIICDDTKDISLKGIYLLVDRPLPVDTPCMIQLMLSGISSELTLNIRGRVVRVDDRGMALEFDEMDTDSLIHLKNILYYNSGDPDRIDAELSGDA